VVGAVIDPGICLDLRCRNSQPILKNAYEQLLSRGIIEKRNTVIENGVPLKRDLDCLVIETAQEMFLSRYNISFDTVIGTFYEGRETYPGAGMREKTHTQICVRNPRCILGYFKPRTETGVLI
jgi:hypothetical protein